MAKSGEEYAGIRTIIKGGTLLVAIIALFCGTQTLQEQYKSKYWAHQLIVYSQLLNSTGNLASFELNSKEFSEAKYNFLSIYYGEVNLISTNNVKIKVNEIKQVLDQLENKHYSSDLLKDKIRFLALELATECRISTLECWQIPLEELKE